MSETADRPQEGEDPDELELLVALGEQGDRGVVFQELSAAGDLVTLPEKKQTHHRDSAAVTPSAGPAPSGRYFTGPELCRLCHQAGHFARDCPTQPPQLCFRCGEPGHLARDCPASTATAASAAPMSMLHRTEVRCFRCDGVGHFARECPGSTFEDTTPSTLCFHCGMAGHQPRDCPLLPRRTQSTGAVTETAKLTKTQAKQQCWCWNCGEAGHTGNACRQPTFEDDPYAPPPRWDQTRPREWLTKSRAEAEVFGPREQPKGFDAPRVELHFGGSHRRRAGSTDFIFSTLASSGRSPPPEVSSKRMHEHRHYHHRDHVDVDEEEEGNRTDGSHRHRQRRRTGLS